MHTFPDFMPQTCGKAEILQKAVAFADESCIMGLEAFCFFRLHKKFLVCRA